MPDTSLAERAFGTVANPQTVAAAPDLDALIELYNNHLAVGKSPLKVPEPQVVPDANPLLHLTARRYSSGRYWSLKDMAGHRLALAAASWDTRKTWRYKTRWGCADLVAAAQTSALLDAHVKAHLREPDRIDILGDLALAAFDYRSTRGSAFGTANLYQKFPQIQVFDEVMNTWGRPEDKRRWESPNWCRMAYYNMYSRTAGARYLAEHELLPQIPGHLVHASLDEPTKVAYIKSVRDLMRGKEDPDCNWVTRTTPGRYLKKFYPHLSDDAVRKFANLHTQENTPVEVKIARSESECIRAVAEGPSESCMCNDYHDHHSDDRPWYKGHVHPAAIYGHDEDDSSWDTDTEILYFEADGKVKARVICNKLTKACARIYGDAQKFKPAIEKLGYRQEGGALRGCRVRKIEDDNGHGHIMAYVDAGTGSGGGNLNYKSHPDSDRHWLIGDNGSSTYRGYENYGTTMYDSDSDDEDDYTSCEVCGDAYETDRMTYVESTGEVCPHCMENFVFAKGRHGREWVHKDYAVYCESDNTWYMDGATDYYEVYVCEVTGEWYLIDNLVSTSRGLVHESRTVALNEEDDDGNDFAVPDDTALTWDGDTIHTSQAVTDLFEDRIYCKYDDDLIRFKVPTRRGGMVIRYFTAETFRDNLDAFWVIGSDIVVSESSRDPAGRGAIPLTEYIEAFGVSDLINTNLHLDAALIGELLDLEETLTHDTKEEAIDYQQAA